MIASCEFVPTIFCDFSLTPSHRLPFVPATDVGKDWVKTLPKGVKTKTGERFSCRKATQNLAGE